VSRDGQQKFRIGSNRAARRGEPAAAGRECQAASCSGRSRHPCTTAHTRRCTSGSNDHARGSGEQGGTRSQTDRALPEPVSRERRYLCAAMGEFRRSIRIFTAALKDWKAINSSRPEDRKKVDRITRKSLPMSDVVIENHLLGKETIGIYPLLPDETCWFLAVDFDKKTWTDDSRAFLDTCQELNVPAALERSRSGNGGHVWIFFEHAIPANTARKTWMRGPHADHGTPASTRPRFL
jgi:hypothetical protein